MKFRTMLAAMLALVGAALPIGPAVHAAVYSFDITANPLSCAYSPGVTNCFAISALSSEDIFTASGGDQVTFNLTYTSTVNVPGSKTENLAYMGLIDYNQTTGVFTFAPLYAADYSTILKNYSGPSNPILSFPYTAYEGFGGFCCGYGEPNGGFSFTAMDETFTIVNGDPNEIVGILYGYYVQTPEPATWALMLTGFAGLGAALRSKRKSALA